MNEMKGSGCKDCPVIPCETMNYRGSTCSAQRAKFGLGDPLTNADRIRAMSVDELALFLVSHNFEQNRQLLESNGIILTATQLSVMRENLLRTWWGWLCRSAKEKT